MKRVLLFLPPPLTHHHSDSNSGLRRTCASYCTALAGECVELARGGKNTTRMSGPTSTYALAAAEEGSPWQQESGAEGCELWWTQVREQIAPHALAHAAKGGLNWESIGEPLH